MSEKKKLLLTGAAGKVGRAVLPFLREKYAVTCFDRAAVPGQADAMIGSIADLKTMRSAVRGHDYIIHLAANPWDAAFEEQLVPNNIVGPYNVLQSAHEYGAKRVVFASTCHTVNAYPEDKLIEVEDPFRPDNLYGVTKAYGEVLGRLYSDRYGLPFVAVRIGWLQAEDTTNIWTHRAADSFWITPQDLADVFIRAIETPGIQFQVVFATSEVAKPRFSLKTAQEVLGYEPKSSLIKAREKLKK